MHKYYKSSLYYEQSIIGHFAVFLVLPSFLSLSSQSHDKTAMMVGSPCHDALISVQRVAQTHTGVGCQVVDNVAMDDVTVNTLSGSWM